LQVGPPVALGKNSMNCFLKYGVNLTFCIYALKLKISAYKQVSVSGVPSEYFITEGLHICKEFENCGYRVY
jgi:hypothetical protein